ncbi:AsmA family protein [Methylobacterium sp. sgz302541]|uniref:AsmA family protein n=1 Tax=unclassified Methylobacterium TaxID=2615210 RepID=UPI003D34EE07
MKRRSARELAPALCLAVIAAAGIVAACMPWSVPAARVTGFATRAFSDYGLAFSAEGAAELTLLPLPRIGFARTRIAAADGTSLAEGGRLTVELAPTALLSGRAELASVVLDGARIDLGRLDGDGLPGGPLRGLAERFAGSGSSHPRRVSLTRCTVTATDAEGSSERGGEVEAMLSWPLWSASLDAAGSLIWHGARTRFAFAGLRPRDLAEGRTSPVSAMLAWPEGTLSVEGSARLGAEAALSGHGRLDARDLPRTLAWIGADMALSPIVRSLSLDGAFEGSATGIMIPRVRVGIGNSSLEGAVSASFEGRPAVQATLAAEDLDLGPLLGGLVRLLDAEQGAGPRPVALKPLTGSDLDLRLSAGSSRIGPVRVEDIAASVLVRGESVEASLSRARVSGSTVKARLALTAAAEDADETELRAQGTFDGLDIGALLAEIGGERWVVGATQGQFALESSGRDVAALTAHVAGRAAFAMEGGAIAGLDLSDVIHRNGALAPGALARRNGRTTFERAAVSLKFANGVGEIGDGFLRSGSVNAAIRGNLSLPERRFTARVTLQPRAVGGEAPRRGTLFDISGPWDGVSVKATRLDQGETDPVLQGPPATSPAALRLPASARAYAP